ncbi:MAG TPA: extensin family protein [Hyphomicrobiaceae bacterium]|nr:extensin family protein [Hyphomicrobiaceae bacterium]
MWLRRVLVLLPAGVALLLSACSTGPDFVAKNEPWRAEEENACLVSGIVHASAFVQGRSALGGPSVCGAARPFEMSAAGGGRVALKPPALLRCPMIPEVERWVVETVEPAARYYFGASLVELTVAASYSCRPMNNVHGASLSEHGYANAIDISGFTLEDGRRVTVKGGWSGEERERAFLRDVHDRGCRQFTTVLGPDHDGNHRDHFHLDLARHGRDGLVRICK